MKNLKHKKWLLYPIALVLSWTGLSQALADPPPCTNDVTCSARDNLDDRHKPADSGAVVSPPPEAPSGTSDTQSKTENGTKTQKGQDTTRLGEDAKKKHDEQVKAKQEADAKMAAAKAAASGGATGQIDQAAGAQASAEIEHAKQSRPVFSQAIEKDALPSYQQRNGHFNYMSDLRGRGHIDTTKNIQKEIDEANAEINRLTAEIANEGLGIGGAVRNQQNAQTQNKEMALAAIEKRRRLIGQIFENAREIAVTTDYNHRVLSSLDETQNQYQRYINSLTPEQRQQALRSQSVVLGGDEVNVREYFGVNTAAEVPQAIAANREFQERGLRIADGYMQTLQREAQGYQVQVERVLAPIAGISGTQAQNLGSTSGGASGVNAGDISKLLGTMQGMGGKGGSGSGGSSGSASSLSSLDGAKGSGSINPYFGKGGSSDPFAKSNANGQSKTPFGTASGASGSSLKSALQAGLASRAAASAGRSGASSVGASGAAGSSLSAGGLKGSNVNSAKNNNGIRGSENAVSIGELDANSRRAALSANGGVSVSDTQQDVQNMQNAMISMLGPDKAENAQRDPAAVESQPTPLGNIDEPLFLRVRQSISKSIEKGNLFNGLDKKLGG